MACIEFAGTSAMKGSRAGCIYGRRAIEWERRNRARIDAMEARRRRPGPATAKADPPVVVPG